MLTFRAEDLPGVSFGGRRFRTPGTLTSPHVTRVLRRCGWPVAGRHAVPDLVGTGWLLLFFNLFLAGCYMYLLATAPRDAARVNLRLGQPPSPAWLAFLRNRFAEAVISALTAEPERPTDFRRHRRGPAAGFLDTCDVKQYARRHLTFSAQAGSELRSLLRCGESVRELRVREA
jgi:hypothetical protein